MTIQLKINDAFYFKNNEVIYFYPRNYGKKVKDIKLNIYLHINEIKVDVEFHVIGKMGRNIEDRIINIGIKNVLMDSICYQFHLKESEVNMKSVYYVILYPQNNNA